MPKLAVEGYATVDVQADKRLVLAIEQDAGVDVMHACGGNARCTTCRVEFIEGEPSRMTAAEKDRLAARGLAGVRLSCQILCDHDMAVRAISRLEGTGRPDPGPTPEATLSHRRTMRDKTLWGAEQLAWLKQTLLESDATFKILISPTPMIGPDDANQAGRQAEGHDPFKRDNHSNPQGFQFERDAFFDWLEENDFLDNHFYIVSGDRHWQYHSIHPRGFEEFSTGALVDANSRLGRYPGDPESNDPDALIEQPFTSPEPTGGFLEVTVTPGAEPAAAFRWFDERGVLTYETIRRGAPRPPQE